MLLCLDEARLEQRLGLLCRACSKACPQPRYLRFAPLLARELGQLGGTLDQGPCAIKISVLRLDLAGARHEERQQDPVFAGIELLDAIGHTAEQDGVAPCL